MKRTVYRGYIIDIDGLGRLTIHNASSPYSEDSDHIMVYADTLKQGKAIIDARIRHSADIRRFSDIV